MRHALVIRKILGRVAASCAVAKQLPATASDNPNRIGLIFFMKSFLLGLLRRTLAVGE
jgi:hypothetical protein